VEFVNEPIQAFASRLRREKGKHIWIMGGAGILASFIGEGIPLIAPRHRTVPLKLLACKKFTDGVVRLHYAVR
jgi:dihydrofolate reductase